MSGAPGTIGLCTDSNSQMPPDLARRFGVEVVPLTVTVDGHEYLEGVDLDVDAFYSACAAGGSPEVHWSTPSAGQFAAAYEDLAARGCTQILSIHTTLDSCAIVRAGRLAAHSSPVPVRLIDSGTSHFGVSCCVWAAAVAIAAGATVDEAATIAETLAPAVGTVFVVEGLDLVRRCGPGPGGTITDHPRAVMAMRQGEVEVIDRIRTVDEAVRSMSGYVVDRDRGQRLNVAVGVAHLDAQPLASALSRALADAPSVNEVIGYRISPSVGAETGPGTVTCIAYPA